jgi:hypothetical protein
VVDGVGKIVCEAKVAGFHRIRHYGLLANAGCKTNIARARELIAAPMPSTKPAEHDDAGATGAVAEHRPPCPFCGGRMTSSKPSSAMAHPEARHRPMPASGAQCHDHRSRLVATSARRNMPLLATHPCRPGACQRRCDAADYCSITPSGAAAATNSQ